MVLYVYLHYYMVPRDSHPSIVGQHAQQRQDLNKSEAKTTNKRQLSRSTSIYVIQRNLSVMAKAEAGKKHRKFPCSLQTQTLLKMAQITLSHSSVLHDEQTNKQGIL